MYFICRPSDSIVSEDAGIEARSVTFSALVVRCYRSPPHTARSHAPTMARSHTRSHPQSARSHPPQLDLIHNGLLFLAGKGLP
jgi:hypothetical protein